MTPEHNRFFDEFSELLKKYGYDNGFAYAVACGSTMYGYGAAWHEGQAELIRKLKIMLSDMQKKRRIEK